jgi:hypothetical protein
VIRVRIGGPIELGEEEAVRLELSAGTALLDYAPYSILIDAAGSELGELVEALTGTGVALGARRIARVGATAARERVDREDVADFASVADALPWLGEGR